MEDNTAQIIGAAAGAADTQPERTKVPQPVSKDSKLYQVMVAVGREFGLTTEQEFDNLLNRDVNNQMFSGIRHIGIYVHCAREMLHESAADTAVQLRYSGTAAVYLAIKTVRDRLSEPKNEEMRKKVANLKTILQIPDKPAGNGRGQALVPAKANGQIQKACAIPTQMMFSLGIAACMRCPNMMPKEVADAFGIEEIEVYQHMALLAVYARDLPEGHGEAVRHLLLKINPKQL
jgi:hypothetical protein